VALYTARQNIVAVITNGTAVLGLGDIGALAAKPVMEGKAVGVLFVATCTFLTVPAT
jgi:malate dehydrogenase (oxaloacetate-decarboxylating)(NADP+)